MASNNNSIPFPLRIKLKGGQPVMLENLTSDTSVGDLKAILTGVTGINFAHIRVLSGFPPKPVRFGKDDTLAISTLGLQPRDTLIIDESREPANNEEAAAKPAAVEKPIFGSSIVKPSVAAANGPGGILIRKVVPSDNSCLFTSIFFCLSSGELNAKKAITLRQIIAETVAGDPELYNDAYLGRPNREYCTWILNQEHWGGAIELSILSRYYEIEMVAIDTQNVRLNRFGEDRNYSTRLLLIYDGIHYDPLVMELFDPNQSLKTIFPSSDDHVLVAGLEIAKECKASRQYTDVQNFTLKCGICQKKLTGQTQAQAHAKETGHVKFTEI